MSSDGTKKDNVTWQLPNDNSVAKFEVDFSSGYCDTATDNDVPFTGKDGKDKKQFTETDSAGTVKNLKPNSPYSICYYKYSITVDGKTTYDPGVIITKP